MRAIPTLPTMLFFLAILAAETGAGNVVPVAGEARTPPGARTRTVAGDLCETATELTRGEVARIDLCDAWGDYDPGAGGCSPCALPGPDVVYRLEARRSDALRITADVASGDPDVRLYLATDCADPAGSCLVASDADGELDHVMVDDATVFLFVDTTVGCGEVLVSLQGAANTAQTTWGALKAIYY